MKKVNSKYFSLRLELTGFNTDILSAVLFEEGCTGVEEYSDNVWLAYFPSFWNTSNYSKLTKILKSVNNKMRFDQILFSENQQEDWNAEWRKHFRPQKIGKSVWISPPWEVPEIKPNEYLIIIDPQMAFGTGHHETTQLAILAIEKFVKPSFSVLDAGTGSGILAILAQRMGSKYIFGFDNDPDAIENANHNAELNDANDIDFKNGNYRVIPRRFFDVVLANMNRSILTKLLPALQKVTRIHGKLILSGILRSEQASMLDAIPPTLEQLELNYKNDWLSIVLNKLSD
jgi:ribosomal protein L11 methyltransferase